MTRLTARLANRAAIDLAALDEAALMACVDHALLGPELTRADVDAGIELAMEWRTATVCCRPTDLPLAVSRLRGSLVGPATVVGFPHGGQLPDVKKREAVVAVEQGAVELDLVINVGWLRSGELGRVRDELGDVIWAVAPTPVKVILETAYLTPEEVETGCRLAAEARAQFVENGTDFSPRGAEPEVIALMRRIVGHGVGVKAAGGVRTLDALMAVLAAGANRAGTTATATIGTEWRARGRESVAAAGRPVSLGSGE